MEHRSNHMRPKSHDTSTNIPDLHETPSNHVRSTVSPQARQPQTSTRSRAHKQNHPAPRTCHEVRELHPTVPPRMAPRNGLPKQQSGVCTRHPENPQSGNH
ncbi:hypothetical protein Taro_011080 [Colocasia esculenta]|uniref:Uncharacterized protein n=1 Tax=Colocasia esculenta TaxID=4460 RepID=A0A843U9X9_COLES|nr:hypothetical protein [Colocasia esculenta]